MRAMLVGRWARCQQTRWARAMETAWSQMSKEDFLQQLLPCNALATKGLACVQWVARLPLGILATQLGGPSEQLAKPRTPRPPAPFTSPCQHQHYSSHSPSIPSTAVETRDCSTTAHQANRIKTHERDQAQVVVKGHARRDWAVILLSLRLAGQGPSRTATAHMSVGKTQQER